MWEGKIEEINDFNFKIHHRKGVLKFVSKKFPKQRKEIENLEKTALVRMTSDLNVKNTNIMSFCHIMSYSFQEDNYVSTYIMPLKGDIMIRTFNLNIMNYQNF